MTGLRCAYCGNGKFKESATTDIRINGKWVCVQCANGKPLAELVRQV